MNPTDIIIAVAIIGVTTGFFFAMRGRSKRKGNGVSGKPSGTGRSGGTGDIRA